MWSCGIGIRYLLVRYSYFSIFNQWLDYHVSVLSVWLLFYQFKAFTSADSDILVLLEGLVGGSNDFKLEGLHVGRGEFKRWWKHTKNWFDKSVDSIQHTCHSSKEIDALCIKRYNTYFNKMFSDCICQHLECGPGTALWCQTAFCVVTMRYGILNVFL